MPAEHTLASLDLLFRRANEGLSATVPVARGPCIFVRRASLDAVGRFDGGPLGSDYGVEQDFCLRASGQRVQARARGRRLRLALGRNFVRVRRSRTISQRAPSSRWAGSIHATPAEREEFATRDPARPFQRRVDLLSAGRVRAATRALRGAWVGRRHSPPHRRSGRNDERALQRSAAAACDCRAGEAVVAQGRRGFLRLSLRCPRNRAALAALLRSLGLVRMHFHHVHGLPRAVLDLPRDAGVPYDCTLHDYYAICPQYHLNTEDGRYCGEPDAAGCAACLSRRPGQWGLDIASWRAALGTASSRRRPRARAHPRRRSAHRALFSRCRGIGVAASRDAAHRTGQSNQGGDIGQSVAGKRSSRRRCLCARTRARAGCPWRFALSDPPRSRCRNGLPRRCRSTVNTPTRI